MKGDAKYRKWDGLGADRGHSKSRKIALINIERIPVPISVPWQVLCPYLAQFLRYSEILVEIH